MLALVTEAVRAMGPEIEIFSVTLVIALLLRTFSGRRAAKSPPARAPAPRARAASGGPGRPCAEQASGCRGTERACPSSGRRHAQGRLWALVKDPPRLVDEVCEVASAQSSSRASEALALYQEMISGPSRLRIAEVAGSSKHSAPEFYHSLVQCAIRAGKPELIDYIIDDMANQGVPRSRQFYESAMKLLAGKRQHRLALQVYNRLSADGIEPSAATWSCLVSFAAEVGDSDRAVAFFEKMCTLGAPSIRAAMTVLRVHAKRQDWEGSLRTLRALQDGNVEVDALLLNIVLATGVAGRQTAAVEKLLEEFAGVRPRVADVVSYNTLIKGFAAEGDFPRAAGAMEQMRAQGVRPNAITYNSAMDAAVRGGSAEEAWRVLKMMRLDGVPADKYTCSILVKGIQDEATAEQLEDCVAVLQAVNSSADAALRAALFATVLAAAARLPDAALLMRAYREMRNQGLSPKASTYQLMIRSLSRQGAAEDCGLLWRRLLSEGVRPRPEVFAAVVDALIRAGDVTEAVAALELLRAGPESDEHTERLATECRPLLVRALRRAGKAAEASQL